MISSDFPILILECAWCLENFQLHYTRYASYYNGQPEFYCSSDCKKEHTIQKAIWRAEGGHVILTKEDKDKIRLNNIKKRADELREYRMSNENRGIFKIDNVKQQVPQSKNDARLDEMVKMHLDGFNMAQISDKFGVTRERVRQLLLKRGHNKKTAPPKPKAEQRLHDLVCVKCRKSFQSKSIKKYCSPECRTDDSVASRKRFVKLVCCGCGVEFERSQYLSNIYKHHKRNFGYENDNSYCTKACFLTNGLRKRWDRYRENKYIDGT